MSVAVTGARGNIGSKVVDLLARSVDMEVVAVVRRPMSETRFQQNVRSALADYSDSAALKAAFAGSETLVLVTSDGDSASCLSHHRNMVAAAVDVGVSRIVALSSLDADERSPFCYAKSNAFTETMVLESGLNVAIARASIFAEFFKEWPIAACRTGDCRLPAGDGRISLVSRDDVARSLASLATEAQPGTYDITGPESLDLTTIVSQASQRFGLHIRYTDITPLEYAIETTKTGLESWVVYAYCSFFQSIREHRWASVSDGVYKLTKRSPVAFREILDAS